MSLSYRSCRSRTHARRSADRRYRARGASPGRRPRCSGGLRGQPAHQPARTVALLGGVVVFAVAVAGPSASYRLAGVPARSSWRWTRPAA